eukprot:tig00021468_g21643.t1
MAPRKAPAGKDAPKRRLSEAEAADAGGRPMMTSSRLVAAFLCPAYTKAYVALPPASLVFSASSVPPASRPAASNSLSRSTAEKSGDGRGRRRSLASRRFFGGRAFAHAPAPLAAGARRGLEVLAQAKGFGAGAGRGGEPGAGAGAGAAEAEELAMEFLDRIVVARMLTIADRLLWAAGNQVLVQPDGSHIALAERLARAHGNFLRVIDPDAREGFLWRVVASGMLWLPDVPEFDDDASLGELVALLNSCSAAVPAAVPYAEACEAFAAGVEAAVKRGEGGPDTWPEEDGSFMEAITCGLFHDALSDEDFLQAARALAQHRAAKLAALPEAGREAYAARLVAWLNAAEGPGLEQGRRRRRSWRCSPPATSPRSASTPPTSPPLELPRRGRGGGEAGGEEEAAGVIALANKVASGLAGRAAGSLTDEDALEILEEVMLAMEGNSEMGETREDRLGTLCSMFDFACRELAFLPKGEPECAQLGDLFEALRKRGRHPLSVALADTAERLLPLLARDQE